MSHAVRPSHLLSLLVCVGACGPGRTHRTSTTDPAPAPAASERVRVTTDRGSFELPVGWGAPESTENATIVLREAPRATLMIWGIEKGVALVAASPRMISPTLEPGELVCRRAHAPRSGKLVVSCARACAEGYEDDLLVALHAEDAVVRELGGLDFVKAVSASTTGYCQVPTVKVEGIMGIGVVGGVVGVGNPTRVATHLGPVVLHKGWTVIEDEPSGVLIGTAALQIAWRLSLHGSVRAVGPDDDWGLLHEGEASCVSRDEGDNTLERCSVPCGSGTVAVLDRIVPRTSYLSGLGDWNVVASQLRAVCAATATGPSVDDAISPLPPTDLTQLLPIGAGPS